MKVFNCPQCAATLEFERIDAPLVRCQFCNSQVVVPPELRPFPVPSPAEPPPLNFGEHDQPKKVVFAIVALLAIAGGIGLLIATNRSSNTNRATFVPPSDTPRITPTPTPKPKGYTVAYTVGGEGTGPGLFKDSLGVAVDAEGRVYVSDDTRRVQRFDPAGKFLNTWNIPTETKWYRKLRGGPDKLLVNHANQLYAVLAGVILKLDGETGEVLGAAHGSDYIHDAAIVPGGGLLVVSQKGDDDELVLMGTDGRAARRTHRFVSSLLDKKLEVEALRVAVGVGGEAYALYAIGGVAGEHWYDDEDLTIFKFRPDNGKLIARLGSGGSQPGQFGVPSAIAADARQRIYVCEPFDKLHVYEADGRFVRTLKTPHAVDALTFDAENNLYIAGGHQFSKLILDK